jgi:hypothetical protein
MDTKTYTDSEQVVIDRVEADLLSGNYFTLRERSNRSARLGGPAVSSRGFSGVMQALAKFAGDSDWATSVAAPALRSVNAYVTPNEVLAQVAASLAKSVHDGYFDVIGATGPEAGRSSAHQHKVTLRQAITLALLMVEVEHGVGYHGSVPGVGWCLAALMEREGMIVPAHLFPATATNQKARAAR